MEHLIITVQGFDFTFVENTNKFIQKVLDFFQLDTKRFFILPSKYRKYTVERSPHIDKKSREQFEIKRYKTIFEVDIKNTQTTQLICYILKNSIYPGTQLSISIEFHDYLV